ncbi:MAG: coproporphyrinogen dehydrogenase HemZ [Lachnospiraceae bacterium]|nr:coproporphyrinogen dehydrogenase HemZ [Lachnospiraceae bacterium]
MFVTQNSELYRYEVHSLVKAFFPAEEVKVIIAEEMTPESAFGVFFSREKIRLLVRPGTPGILSFSEEKDYEECACVPEGSDLSYCEKGPETKAALKKLLYEFLVRMTGKNLPWGDLIGIRPTKLVSERLRSGLSEEECIRFMEEEHLVSHEKAVLAYDIARREEEILGKLDRENGYSLYIGIPFCPTTCLYCSFPSFSLSAWAPEVDRYLDTLEREMAAASALMQDKKLETLYIGGGTPTTLEPKQLERLLTCIEKYYDLSGLLEFTVEAGRADSITREKLMVLRNHPVTRISVNPQTMRDETLRMIGRHHTVAEVIEAFQLARECGFDNINMDIILGLPGEKEEDVQYTVDEICKLSPESLTVHSLAVKRASRLARWIEQNGIGLLHNSDESMAIAARAAQKMDMVPYYLYRQKNMSGNFENVGYAREGSFGIYNMLIIEEVQSIMALGAGSISKCLFEGGRIERCDNAKEVRVYMDNIEEMIGRKRKLFGGQ